jgi:beta-N-acetylhexosaminidase
MKKLLFFLFLVSCFFELFSQTLEEKIGQMIMVGLPNFGTAKDTMIIDITERNLGGVILYGYNLLNPWQIRSLTYELQTHAGGHLFIAVDQEGGLVARLNQNNGYATTHSAYTLGTIYNSEDSTRAQAELMASWLNEAGFNMNLAPVVDVNVNPASPAIGAKNRSFSSDEFVVYQHASWFIDAFNQQNIATALKHFPGHGSALNDSHLGFTEITSTWEDRELDPYRLLIQDGYKDAIMTGHLVHLNWDTEYPASLSHYAVTSILRDSLGFEGVVITDELFMGALSNNYGLNETIVKTINAGSDLLLFNTNIYNSQSLVRYIISLVLSKIASGDIEESTIDAAYERISELKERRIHGNGNSTAIRRTRPFDFRLSNFPNPFHSLTTIKLTLPEVANVLITLTDSRGQVLKTITNGKLEPGSHTLLLNASDLSPGVYFLHLQTVAGSKAHPILLVR